MAESSIFLASALSSAVSSVFRSSHCTVYFLSRNDSCAWYPEPTRGSQNPVSNDSHLVARKQMDGGFGAMLSIHLGSRERALAVAGRMSLFLRATSLGGTESLVEHRASVEPPDSPVAPDLLRLSIGLEDVEDLWADLAQAVS